MASASSSLRLDFGRSGFVVLLRLLRICGMISHDRREDNRNGGDAPVIYLRGRKHARERIVLRTMATKRLCTKI